MITDPYLRGRATALTGRRGERDVLDRLIDAVRAGESRALVVAGEPGAGKTALLDYVAGRAAGCRVARVMGVQSARAHLLYGEWLRREWRRADARQQLHIAHDMLEGMGIEAFAERARRELAVAGETARKRTVETTAELTVQENRIARLARDGLSNPEIGARLFISPRTVQYHLGKVFTKLAISSRSQFDRVLPDEPAVTT
jgi:DNA-binding CsgD family transcriptional regulator